MSNFTTSTAQKTLSEVKGWLDEFGAMADGNGSRCARLMRELLTLVDTRHSRPARIWDEERKMYRHPDDKPEDDDPRPDYYRGHHVRCDIWPGGLGHCTCAGPLSEEEQAEYKAKEVVPPQDAGTEPELSATRIQAVYTGTGLSTTFTLEPCPKCNGMHTKYFNGGNCMGPPLPTKPPSWGMMG